MTSRILRSLLVIAATLSLAGLAPAQETTSRETTSRETTEQPTPEAEPSGPRIEQAVLVRLVRTILIAVNNANLTGNYTVLRDLGSPAFAVNNTAATLAERFKPLREGRVELSPILVLPINLTRAPQLDAEGRLDIEGTVPTRPLLVSFRMRFEAIDGSWRLSDLAIGLNATEDPDQIPADAGANGTEQATPEAATDSGAAEQPIAENPDGEAEPDANATGPRAIPLPTPKPRVDSQ